MRNVKDTSPLDPKSKQSGMSNSEIRALKSYLFQGKTQKENSKISKNDKSCDIGHLAGIIIQEEKRFPGSQKPNIDSSRIRGNSSRGTSIKNPQSTRDDKTNKSYMSDFGKIREKYGNKVTTANKSPAPSKSKPRKTSNTKDKASVSGCKIKDGHLSVNKEIDLNIKSVTKKESTSKEKQYFFVVEKKLGSKASGVSIWPKRSCKA
jgi:hypothetical protein